MRILLKKFTTIAIASLISAISHAEETPQLFAVEQNNLLGFINENGKVIVEPQFDKNYRETGRDDLINVKKNGKRGILNTNKEIIIPTIYDDDFNSFDFNGGHVASFMLNQKCGYITDQNEIIIKNIYEECSSFSKERATVKLNNKWALIDQQGKVLTDFIFDEIDQFSEGLSAIQIDGKYGYINTDGKIVIQPTLAMGSKFVDGMARIGSINSSYYFIDKKGQKLFDVNFDHVYPFVGDYAVIRKDIGTEELYGLIDKQGKVYIKPKFADIAIDEIQPELAVVEVNKLGNVNAGILNLKTQEMIVEAKYEAISTPYYGLSYFKLNGKYGWMNDKFEIVISPKFDDVIYGFGPRQLAIVKVENQIIYINRKGEKVSNFYLNE